MTIRDVAELAGVSVGTVSKVLNNQGNVKPSLRLRVEAVVEKLNYRPSAIARSFKSKETRMIGLIIPRIVSQFYVEFVHHTERRLKAEGYTLFLANTEEDVDTELRDLRTFAKMRVDGLIITSSSRQQEPRLALELAVFQDLGIPVVVAARRINDSGLDMVTVDYATGSHEATKYLLDEGHRRIGVLAAPSHSSAGADQASGYLRALAEAEVAYDPELVSFGNRILEKDYYRISEMLVGHPNPPTAILVASSFRLVSVLRALRAHGKAIPDDVSVICFGDADWFEFMYPPLTVATIPTEEVSRSAQKMLMERIRGEYDGEPRSVSVRPKLLLRGSVKTLQ